MSDASPQPIANLTTKRMGVIKANPVEIGADGLQLQIAAIRFHAQETNGITSLANWDQFRGTVLQFHFRDSAVRRITGFAVMVAPGIALTAWHIIEPEEGAIRAGTSSTLMTGITPHGMSIWRPRAITHHPESDIAIVSLEYATDLPPGGVFPQLRPSTRTPRVGERVMIVGFRAETIGASPAFGVCGQLISLTYTGPRPKP